MPICKFCSLPFAWGLNEGKYTPLVPVEDHDDLPRAYQDENGVLRAEHLLVCVRRGGPTVRVARLAVAVKPENILPRPKPGEEIDQETGEITIQNEQ